MKKSLIGAAICAASVLGIGGTALAEGPPKDVFVDNENTWNCEFGPPNHCINVRSQGNTGLIMVLYPDPRWPAEGISFDPKADSRPCPHDGPDGTWWYPGDPALPETFWVCHRRPS